MIGACIEAYECTHGEEWAQLATTCFNWYLGKNDQQLQIYDHASGGCRDGLERDGVNENQGAESTLSYILSLLAVFNLRGLSAKPNDNKEAEIEGYSVDSTGKRLKSIDLM